MPEKRARYYVLIEMQYSAVVYDIEKECMVLYGNIPKAPYSPFAMLLIFPD